MTDPFGTPEADDKTFEFDLDDDTKDRYYVDPGAYGAACVALEEDISKAGNPMLVWTFAIFQQGPHVGKELKIWTVLNASAMWKLREVCEALGLVEEGAKHLKFQKKDALMRKCVIVVEDREYNGRTTSSIGALEPYPGA